MARRPTRRNHKRPDSDLQANVRAGRAAVVTSRRQTAKARAWTGRFTGKRKLRLPRPSPSALGPLEMQWPSERINGRPPRRNEERAKERRRTRERESAMARRLSRIPPGASKAAAEAEPTANTNTNERLVRRDGQALDLSARGPSRPFPFSVLAFRRRTTLTTTASGLCCLRLSRPDLVRQPCNNQDQGETASKPRRRHCHGGPSMCCPTRSARELAPTVDWSWTVEGRPVRGEMGRDGMKWVEPDSGSGSGSDMTWGMGPGEGAGGILRHGM